MDIKLKITRKNEDGSADAVVDYDDEGLVVIIQYGVTAIIKEALEQEKQMKKKKVDKDLMYKLEDDIEKFYSVIDDLELLYKTHGDRRTPMSEDEVANNMLGIINWNPFLINKLKCFNFFHVKVILLFLKRTLFNITR